MRPSRAGSSSQSRGSVWFKQRAGFLAASNSAAVGFLASGAGSCPVVGVPVVLAFGAVEVPAAVPAVGGGEPAPASRPVEVLPAAFSAGAGRVQSRRRSASKPAASGVAVLVPGVGAAGPAVRVATAPAASGLFVLAAVEPVPGRCVEPPAASAAGAPSRPGGAQVERVGVEPAAVVPSRVATVATVAPVGAPAGEPVEVSARSLAASVATAAPAPVSASGRWACKPVSPGEPAAVPSGVIPAGAAAVPRVEVPAVAFPQVPAREPVGLSPMSAAVLRGAPVEVSALSSGFPGGRFVLAVSAVSGPAVVLAVVILAIAFLSFASAFRAADQERTRLWSLMG